MCLGAGFCPDHVLVNLNARNVMAVTRSLTRSQGRAAVRQRRPGQFVAILPAGLEILAALAPLKEGSEG